jgi:outer membrane receptor protein involved in Fe transport
MKSNHTAYRRGFGAVALCLAILPGAHALAQSSASEQTANEGVLEEVIVTAQRRETNLQRTALAATVLSGQELKAKGVTDLVGVQYVAPSVNISDFGSANVFNIRGIGRSKVDIEIPSGVVIYSDGVPSIAGYFQNEPYYDIAAVEVLRGPQGTFVGKSAAVWRQSRTGRGRARPLGRPWRAEHTGQRYAGVPVRVQLSEPRPLLRPDIRTLHR